MSPRLSYWCAPRIRSGPDRVLPLHLAYRWPCFTQSHRLERVVPIGPITMFQLLIGLIQSRDTRGCHVLSSETTDVDGYENGSGITVCHCNSLPTTHNYIVRDADPRNCPLLIYFHIAYFHRSPRCDKSTLMLMRITYSRISMTYATRSHLNTTKFYKIVHLPIPSLATFALCESLITSIHAYDLLFTCYATSNTFH